MSRRAIAPLPVAVVERIAAGEVIERPASVVRELLDNALDAGATEIAVEVRAGGIDLIRVSDNGWGMDVTDLAYIGTRHATSKIGTLDDLEHIDTYGFRGEALASLILVADVTITTACEGETTGRRARYAPEGRLSLSPTARRPGATVAVERLFRDIPARRRFLDQAASEARKIGLVVRQYALSRTDVGFSLLADGKSVVLSRGGGSDQAVIASCLGANVAAVAIPFQLEAGNGVEVCGWVTDASVTRSTRQHVLVAVNGRPVAVKGLQDYVESAYRPVLPRGRHPYALISITAPPADIDVTVHPAKESVVLRTLDVVGTAVGRTMREALGSRASQLPETMGMLASNRQSLPFPAVSSRGTRGVAEPPSSYGKEKQAKEGLAVTTQLAGMRLLGQVSRHLIAVESDHSLFLVDQHRAHERIIYERLTQEGSGIAQELVEPIVLELRLPDAERFSRRLDALRSLGFRVEHVGRHAFLVHTVPASTETTWLSEDDLWLEAALPGDDWLDRVRAAVACRTALRRGQALSFDVMRQLLLDLAELAAPAVCPHGSPLVVELPLSILARQFDWD